MLINILLSYYILTYSGNRRSAKILDLFTFKFKGKSPTLWRLEQMTLNQILNECCITKISSWGAREDGEATAIYTRQVLSEPLTRWHAPASSYTHYMPLIFTIYISKQN